MADPRRATLPPLGALIVLASLANPAAAQTAFPLDEASFSSRLARIDAEWNLHFQTGDKVRVLPARELAYYGRYRDVEAGPQVLLADGSVIRGDVLLIDDEQVVIGDATGLGRGQWDESSLPRSAVRAILLQPPAGKADRDQVVGTLRVPSDQVVGTLRVPSGGTRGVPASFPTSDDHLLLVGGESVSGTLIDAPRGGRFEPADSKPGDEVFQLLRRGTADPLAIPAAKVVALRFAAPLAPPRVGDGLAVWLGLADGSLVLVREIAVRGDAVTLRLAASGELKTTLSGRDDPSKTLWDAVTYVEPVSQRVAWLSDVEPIGYKHIPLLSVERPYGRDASAVGSRLRLPGGPIARKGLGMPSASRLAYDVAGYRKFEAEIALDERAGLEGSVVFKVLLETTAGQWTTAYDSPILRGGDAPIPISIDLQGASRLALLIDFADRGDALDYANWLHARLVK